MPEPTQRSGVVEVGLQALADPVFFLALVQNPREAIAHRDRLRITPDEIEQVVQLVESSRDRIDANELLAMWRDYHAIGTWDPRGWNGEWRPPEFPVPPRPSS